MSPTRTCPRCGTEVNRALCHACGVLAVEAVDLDAEMAALEEFHGVLARAPAEVQVTLLRNGFLPDRPHALVEAGLRLIPLIDADRYPAEPTESAVQRMRAVASKCRLMLQNPQAQKAAEEFEAILNRHDAGTASDQRAGCWLIGILGFILLAAVGILAYWLRR